MKSALVFVLVLLLSVESGWADEPRLEPAAEFKVNIDYFRVRKEPVRRAQLVVRKGQAFWLLSESNEVVIYDSSDGQISLLDLKRRIHTELLLPKLESAFVKVKQSKTEAIEKLERAGGRANLLAAGMSRDLVEPNLKIDFDAAQNRLKLKNGSVTIDALGESDSNASRRHREAEALAVFLKLEAVRDPKILPPFAALDTLRRLDADHSLRPAELTFVFRLAGPPHKERWVFRYREGLSAEDDDAISRIVQVNQRTRYVRFDRYVRDEE